MKIYSLNQLKKGKKYRVIPEELKKRFGKCALPETSGILEYIEPYSENRNLGHFKTEIGVIISLKASEVELL